MSDEEIEAFAAQLEAEVHAGDAKFRIEYVEENDEENDDKTVTANLVANRAGFLSLAVLMLRSSMVEEDAYAILTPNFRTGETDIWFDNLYRRERWGDALLNEDDESLNENDEVSDDDIVDEDFEPFSKTEDGSPFWRQVGCYSFFVVSLFLILVGLITVWQWIL